ncbi:MAG: 4-hydroxybenzoate polyprenyltransferase [Janthinobacterium sp.]|jgi:4-hydroxybenzoate polyprenyltransferase
MTSFEFSDSEKIAASFHGFLSMGMVASATYLFNDLIDLDSDRNHPRKRFRPLASGAIGIVQAIATMLVMLSAGLALAVSISPLFVAAVVAYLVLTIAYSLFLKRKIMIDVLCLAGLYTWRIIAGAIALNLDTSNWLLAFSMFLFLSLALMKRCAELISLAQSSQTGAKGRGYLVSDTAILSAFGATSGYLAVLVIVFYIDTPTTAINYNHPRALWLLSPLLVYWISRLWIKTTRGEMHDDPIVYAARDFCSWIVLIIFCAITLFAWHMPKFDSWNHPLEKIRLFSMTCHLSDNLQLFLA